MVASATYMQFWFPQSPAIVWIALFSLFLLSTNLLSVHRYGRFAIFVFSFTALRPIPTGNFGRSSTPTESMN